MIESKILTKANYYEKVKRMYWFYFRPLHLYVFSRTTCYNYYFYHVHVQYEFCLWMQIGFDLICGVQKACGNFLNIIEF